jgi:hypothetical protein
VYITRYGPTTTFAASCRRLSVNLAAGVPATGTACTPGLRPWDIRSRFAPSCWRAASACAGLRNGATPIVTT